MNISLEITKKSFNVLWNVFADIAIHCVVFLCYCVLPIFVPMAGYFALIRNDTGKITGLLFYPGLFFLLCLLLFVFAFSFFLIALYEKTRLPIRLKLTDKNFFILIVKKGTQWKIRYANCRFADSFFSLFFGRLFRGTMARGITFYIPKEHLDGFPRGFDDIYKDHPPNMSLHFPIDSANNPEVVSFLESKNCRRIPPMSINKILLVLFAPALFLWIHAAVALLLHKHIGAYGIYGLSVIGLVSGILVALSAFTKPYSKIEYLRRKSYTKIKIGMMIAFFIGLPIYLWITQLPERHPSLFDAVFVASLCYVESYLWSYCLLKRERQSTD
jgi:hypothetical protein